MNEDEINIPKKFFEIGDNLDALSVDELKNYISILETALQKKIPFICANPDFDTIQKKSKKLVFCMGTIAELYKSMGGEVYLEGKPNVLIYHQAVKKLTDIKKEKILAIGDSLFHDITGAINFNIDSLLITSGIHSQDFGFNKTNNITFPDKLKKIGILPTFLSSEFKF